MSESFEAMMARILREAQAAAAGEPLPEREPDPSFRDWYISVYVNGQPVAQALCPQMDIHGLFATVEAKVGARVYRLVQKPFHLEVRCGAAQSEEQAGEVHAAILAEVGAVLQN